MEAEAVSLEVEIAGIAFRNPVWLAAGPAKYGRELAQAFPLSAVGAVVTKGTSLEPWLGNPGLRAVRVPAGLLGTVGLQNPGIRHYLTYEAPWLRQQDTRIVVNIVGKTPEEYAEVARQLGPESADAVEVNVSCPNVKEGGAAFGTHPEATYRVVAAVRQATRLPVLVKLTPNVTDPVPIAQAAEAAGADALTVANAFTGMAIDIYRRRPALDTRTGGLTGPATKPLILRMVWDVVGAVRIPVVACGGVVTWEDAVEYLLAGARAVQVASGLFRDPLVPVRIVEGLRRYLAESGFRRVEDIIGLARREPESGAGCAPAASELPAAAPRGG